MIGYIIRVQVRHLWKKRQTQKPRAFMWQRKKSQEAILALRRDNEIEQGKYLCGTFLSASGGLPLKA